MDPRKLLTKIEARREEFVESLRQMVNIDSGSFTPEGVNRVADLCEARFVAGGWKVERRSNVPPPGKRRLGDVVIGRIEGPGGPRVLLLGHMDTVFPDGTVAERPFRIEGSRAYGPGVSDMKSGLLAGFFAVEALVEAGEGEFGSVTYVCNPDEEIGSPFSSEVISELAREADVCFVLEAARENGDIVSARKGVGDADIVLKGRAAHAGVEPERGASAILEAAHKVVALHDLNGRWPGVTVNVGVVGGGTRPNVVADRCELEVDIRAVDAASQEEAMSEVRRIAETNRIPGVELDSFKSRSWHPPMEKTPEIAALVVRARDIGTELGLSFGDSKTGGASDGNTVAAAGVPTLDGLGPVGGGWHGPDEWLDLESLPARTALLAGLLGGS